MVSLNPASGPGNPVSANASASSNPADAPSKDRRKLSTSIVWITRARLAPSAARIVSSCSRDAALATSTPATLTDPISRTSPNKMSRTTGKIRKPTGVPRNCIASTAKTCAGRASPSFISGKSRSSLAPRLVAAARARSQVVPGASLASTLSVGLPRSFNVASVSALTGTYAPGVMNPVTDR